MKHHLPLALSVALAASFLAVTRSLASDSLSWVAGSGTWSDSVSAGWSPSTAVPAGQDVIFAAAGQGTVSVDGTVTPATVAVLGGDYVFQQLAGTVGGIETSGSFSVSGADTRLTLAMENVGMSGEVVLAGGSLVLGEQNATGSATILFNGGSLAYASGVTRNLGELVGTGSTSVVRVDTGDNDVTWGNRNASNIPGFVAALSNGIEKSGSGMLSLLEIQGSAGSYAGDISVLGGRLNIYADYATGSAGSSAAIVLNGDISVAEGAWLSLGTTFDSSNSNRMTLAGSLGGSGTVEIGNPENVHAGAENKAGGGRYAIRGDNSAFAGTLRLSGLPASATLLYNGAEFASDAAVGGSASTLQLNGRQFWILETRSVHSLPMAVELVDGSNTVFHPNANQIYNFTGALTGGGTLSGLDGRAATVQFSGDIAACSGSLVSGSSNVFLLGGSDAVSPGGDINMSLGGSGLFVINYSSAVTLAGSFQGAASLQQSGAGVLTLVSSSSSTGALVVDAGCVLNIGSASRSATWAGGSVAGLGTLVLVNGGLTENLGMPTVQIVVDAAAGASVSAGGTDGSFLSSITLPAGSSLTGVSGDISAGGSGLQSLDLTLTEANVGSGVAAAAKIDQGDATLSLSTGAAIRVALSPDALVDTLVAHDDAGVESYLTLTSGTLEVADLADVVVSPFLETTVCVWCAQRGGVLL